MSRSKNTIKFSDISTTPIKLKYSASYANANFGNAGISIIRGINTPVTSSVKVPQFKINYNLIEQLFYRNYISGSLLFSGSAYDSSYQSTAASGTFDDDIRYFPTQSNAEIVAFYIPRNVFGEQIARNSFVLNTPRYYIYDDGNGNLLDLYAGNVKVGNIIYSQAFAIITNEFYKCFFIDTSFSFTVEESGTPIVPSASPSVTPSITPSITITPTITPSVSVTPSITPSITQSPSATPSVTPSVTPSLSVGAPVPSVTPSVSPSISLPPPVTPSPSPVISISLYSRAGSTVTSGDTYSLYYSEDNTNYTLVNSGLSSTNCLLQGTFNIAGPTLYIRAVRDSYYDQLIVNGANSSTCPSNSGVTCNYQLNGITNSTSVAITVYVAESGGGAGDFFGC